MDVSVSKVSFNDHVNDLESLLDLNQIINNSEFGFHHRTIAMREKIELINNGLESPVSISDEVIMNEISLCESLDNRHILLCHYRNSFSADNVQFVKWLEVQEKLFPSQTLYKEIKNANSNNKRQCRRNYGRT